MNSATLSIVNYQQPKLLYRCLRQIQALNLPPSWETIVVENSVGDESLSVIRSEFGWVRLLSPGKNLGFAGGHNLAFASSNSKVFFVLNPDIVVLENSLSALVRQLETRPKAAIAGPCLLNPDGSMQYSARRFYSWKTVFGRRLPIFDKELTDDYHLMKNVDLTVVQKVDWLLGAAMAIRCEAFPGKDLFDRRYTLYFEDVDLCYFVQKRGWEVIYCPDSTMIHNHQRASGKGINKAVCVHFLSWMKFWLKTQRYKRSLLI